MSEFRTPLDTLSLMRVSLTFYRDGKMYAARSWHVIPRVGDRVLLNDGNPPEPGKRPRQLAFPVTEVVIGEFDERTGRLPGALYANIALGEPDDD